MNQRRRTRVESRKGVTITWPEGEARGEVVNVSLKGCLIGSVSGDLPDPGQSIVVSIHLEDGEPNLDVVVHGATVRADPTGVAVDFTEVPSESFPHLFRLVQYNAVDPDGIEEELGSSAFGNPEGNKS